MTQVLWCENLPYEQALALQNQTLENQGDFRDTLILTSHPACLTIGRGLQKRDGTIHEGLKDLTPEQKTRLLNGPFPLHEVFRGGGLTFHHERQFIVYWIRRLTPEYTLGEHLALLSDSIKLTLQQFAPTHEFSTALALRGVWGLPPNQAPKKLASIGVGVRHMTTIHGLALNLRPHPILAEVSEFLGESGPCGMSAQTYSSVEEFTGLQISFKEFGDAYVSVLKGLGRF